MADRWSLTLKLLKGGFAMGLGTWTIFLAGALAGQISLIVPFLSGAGYFRSNTDLELSVARAVSETLKFCVDLEPTTSSTTTPSSDFFFFGESPKVHIIWWLLSVFWLALTTLIATCGCGHYWVGHWRKSREYTNPSLGDLSPVSLPVSLETLARNQLAELRVRRHADRASRSWSMMCRGRW